MACFLSLIQIHKYDRLDILETNFRPSILEGESMQESETALCYIEAEEGLYWVCEKSQHTMEAAWKDALILPN